MYRQLNADKIVATSRMLERRVALRFAGSGLSELARELVALAESAAEVARWLEAPHRIVRVAVGLGLVLIVAAAGGALWALDLRREAFASLSDLAQGLEALIGDVVFLCVGAFFLLSTETRLKRRRALSLVRELRAMAHIIDLHQLSKDPELLRDASDEPPGTADTDLSPVELARYLNYSSELLSLLSKLAALLVQGFDDPVTLAAVDEIEDLAGGMSHKIWQKITIIEHLLPGSS